MLRRAAATTAALVIFMASAVVVGASPARGEASGCPDSSQPCIKVTWTTADSSSSHHKIFVPADFPALVGQETASYHECSPASCSQTNPSSSDAARCGIPIRNLLSALANNLGPDGALGVQIRNPGNGHVAELYGGSQHDFDLNSAPEFPFIDTDQDGNRLYPIVYPVGGADSCDTANGIGYIRPQRDNTQDVNYLDNFQVDGELNVDVQFAADLHPQITASRTHITSGQSVRFTAELHDGPTSPTYAWTVGDELLGSGSRIVHRFTVPGQYVVSVSASTTNASGTDSVEIYVGQARRSGPPGPGRGEGNPHAAVNGPDSGTGLHAGARPSAAKSGPRGAHNGGTSVAPGRTHGATRSARATPTAVAADAPGFVSVNGILLNPSAAAAVPRVQRRAGQPETAPAARAGSPQRASIVFAVTLSASVLVLLALGVLGESRRPGRGGRRRSHS